MRDLLTSKIKKNHQRLDVDDVWMEHATIKFKAVKVFQIEGNVRMTVSFRY